jgi:heme/copper-type cytochrome/quinol oxidase subunit 4
VTVLQRFILFVSGLSLAVISLPYFMHSTWHMDQGLLMLNMILGLTIALYNFFFLYKKATTIRIVIASENINDKGDDEDV